MANIKRIKLHNFYNYYGENNEYIFQNGMNVIIADNNGGKSKLYNAFLLIISNEIIDSDNRKIGNLESKKNKFKVLSDKAKKEAVENDKIKSGVSLTFETVTYQFTIMKSFFSTKINQKSPYDIDNWNIEELKTIIIRKTKENNNTKLIELSKEQEKIDLLLPYELRHYCMFQGEEVVNLVNSGLTNAINKLTDLKKFTYLEIFLNDIYKTSDSKLRSEEKKLANNKGEAERLDNEIKNIEESIELLEKNRNEKNDDIIEVEQRIDELSRKIGEAEKQNEIYEKIGANSVKLDSVTSDIESFEENYNQNFFSKKWILKGFTPYRDKFDKLRSKYESDLAQYKVKEFKTSLPQDSPDIPSLDKMLSNEICLVCGRKADKGSNEYIHIENLKKEHEDGRRGEGHSSIKIFCDHLYREVNNFPTDNEINNSIKQKIEKLTALRNLNVELSAIKAELLNKRNSNKDENLKIIDDHRLKNKQKSILDRQLSDLENQFSTFKSNLKSKRKKLDDLVEDNSSLKPLKKKVQILDELKEIFIKTRKRFYNEESKKFEESINNIYKSLTKGNETNPGNVEISVDDRFRFISELKNEAGGSLSGQGAAFQRMKQLAIVMGLMKESRRSSSFPLIADAPISEMGEILTQNFFYNIPKVFKQSIIFIKDFYKSDGELNDIGKYIISDSALNIKAFMNEAVGREQQDRETNIKLISDGKGGLA
jgi:DNA sulfur modification protein DndD